MSGTDSSAHDEHEHHSVWFYTAIAIALALITGIELLPLFELLPLPPSALIGLSVVKFFAVVAFFMHLWDDAPILSQVFVAPLIGAILMVTVLMLLFHTFRPSYKDDSFAVEERYAENYSGECQSFLRSHRTGRLYCASPPMDMVRVARLTPGVKLEAGGAAGPKDDPAVLNEYNGLGTDMERVKFLTKKGEGWYGQYCASCHQANGQGVAGAFPPLAGAGDYYGDAQNHANIIVNGLQGKIVVLGVEYNGVMQAWGENLTDLQIAAIATYERHAWGNDDGLVTPEDVAAVR